MASYGGTVEGWTRVDTADEVEDRDEGLARVGSWLASRGMSLGDLRPDDLRIDILRVPTGACRYRFWIRTKALAAHT